MASDADFTAIEPDCTIEEVVYVGEYQRICERKSGNSQGEFDCGCLDTYSYLFNASQLADIDDYSIGAADNYIFESVEDTIEREDIQDCSWSEPTTPRFTIGEQVKCWRPTIPGYQPSGDECGNEECIKILGVSEFVNESKVLWVTGLVCVVTSLPLFF